MEKKDKFNLIFVCTGNTCRSPMAEYMFKAYLKTKKRQSDFNVQSAGLYARRGDVLSATADEALDALGIKHSAARRAKPFTVMMAEDSDLIVAMTERHAEIIGDGDVISYDRLIGKPVDDPFGGSLDSYLNCAKAIRSGFDDLLALCDKLASQKQ
ncbi:MAG: low molecular weight protein arginine phosphatase [Clostridiales bacterium]|nr:low molecular weight protein arginine phosphatase [Clostridiales bacterium]